MSQQNVISIKRWGSRLAGKPSAKALRQKCENLLVPNHTLVINMAGVRDISPGFAQECFGKLQIEAEKQNSILIFRHTKEELSKIILSGIKAQKRPPRD